jgi:hypothetical protein
MNPTRCRRLAIAVFGGLAALDAAAAGQTVDFLGQVSAVGPIVRDAPYTAESVTTFTQTLGDGTRIDSRSSRSSIQLRAPLTCWTRAAAWLGAPRLATAH